MFSSFNIDFVSESYPDRIPIEEAFHRYTLAIDRMQNVPIEIDEKLIEAFRQNELVKGRWVALALKLPLKASSQFEVISKTMWEVLKIEIDRQGKWTASGPDINFMHIQAARSRLIYETTPPAEFSHNEDYSEVVMRGHKFELSLAPAAIVRILYEAAKSNRPELEGKELLFKASAKGAISDHFKRFKHWGELIERTGVGKYRLNLRRRPRADQKAIPADSEKSS